MNETTTKLGDKWRSEVGGLYQVIHIIGKNIRIKLISAENTQLVYFVTQQTLNRRFQKQAGSI